MLNPVKIADDGSLSVGNFCAQDFPFPAVSRFGLMRFTAQFYRPDHRGSCGINPRLLPATLVQDVLGCAPVRPGMRIQSLLLGVTVIVLHVSAAAMPFEGRTVSDIRFTPLQPLDAADLSRALRSRQSWPRSRDYEYHGNANGL